MMNLYFHRCGHCKALAPEYEKAAELLRNAEYPVVLGKVDATVHEKLANAIKVEGYPTLKFFKHGIIQDYEGPRDAAGKRLQVF